MTKSETREALFRAPRALSLGRERPRDQLLTKIAEVAARDPRIAQALRRLAEGFQYQKLLDLFTTGTSHES